MDQLISDHYYSDGLSCSHCFGVINTCDDKSSPDGCGGVICGFMFLILFALKLGVGGTAVMGWSWWWITAPLWVSWGLFVLVIIIGLFCLLVALCIDTYAKMKK